jgi:MFS transporter, ACS family, allantoate permease
MAEKEVQTPVVASMRKSSIEKEIGAAKIKADELGIEVGHVQDFKGADKMFAYASADAMSIDEETNKKLVRKIDMNVLPWLCVLYVLQYLDKGV